VPNWLSRVNKIRPPPARRTNHDVRPRQGPSSAPGGPPAPRPGLGANHAFREVFCEEPADPRTSFAFRDSAPRRRPRAPECPEGEPDPPMLSGSDIIESSPRRSGAWPGAYEDISSTRGLSTSVTGQSWSWPATRTARGQEPIPSACSFPTSTECERRGKRCSLWIRIVRSRSFDKPPAAGPAPHRAPRSPCTTGESCANPCETAGVRALRRRSAAGGPPARWSRSEWPLLYEQLPRPAGRGSPDLKPTSARDVVRLL